ncbi:MAG: prepilin-type N-terminal cleavage/methylation domain-containing protein [Candidatus Paceibacterota bacterium]|jgi:prepilin-type N-terminal cleavage/methylation domain-containing protein
MYLKSSQHRGQRGFTLIELLVVIAILAILATVIVVIINPGELLKQSRDASRLSDIASINNALAMLIADQPSVSFASTTSGTVYVSLPASNANCSDIGLPSNYACVTSTNLSKTNGMGWVPIDLTQLSTGSPLARLPLDPSNNASSSLYYMFMADPVSKNWKFSSSLESQKYLVKTTQDGGTQDSGYEMGSDLTLGSSVFPSGWVRVPGSGTFGTSDFWVMKYEAKCVANSALNTGLVSPDTGYNTYSDSGTACTAANSRTVASLQSGYPIANISHNTAKTYCTNLGSGSHLLTNEEYMTIARNAEQQTANWNGGVVGTSYLFSGHNDNTPALALQASTDSDPYSGTGNSTPSNQKRTFTLANGNTIWDLSGNVWEHVQRTSSDTVTALALPTCSDGVAGWGWCQYGNSTLPYVSAWTGDVAQNYVGPSNTSWNSTQGMGQVYTYKNGTSQGTTVLLRGGSWSSGSSAGAFGTSLCFGMRAIRATMWGSAARDDSIVA